MQREPHYATRSGWFCLCLLWQTDVIVLENGEGAVAIRIRPGRYNARPMSGLTLAIGTIINLTADGAWTWFNDPRAIYDDGRVLAGWVNAAGDIQFASHDLVTGKTAVVTLDARFGADDHNNPSLLKNRDGTITVFWAPHGGPEIRAVVVTPGANNGWTSGRVVAIPKSADDPPGEWGWSYANPLHLSGEGRTYLASRGPNFNPVFRVNDQGQWGAAMNFILNPGERPYVKYDSNGIDRFSFAWTDAHPLGHHNNVYFASYKAGAYWRADGTKIEDVGAGALSMADAKSAIVFDHTANAHITGDNSWIWDIATDPSDRPVVAFATFRSAAAHQYHWARWDGARWIDRILVENAGGSIAPGTDELHYSGGIALDHTDPRIVYLSRQAGDAQWDIEQHQTRDGGETWSRLTIVTETGVKNIRPVVPHGRPPETQMVLWMSGGYGYWDFSRNGGYQTGIRFWASTRRR